MGRELKRRTKDQPGEGALLDYNSAGTGGVRGSRVITDDREKRQCVF
jgi:hypothetical protein